MRAAGLVVPTLLAASVVAQMRVDTVIGPFRAQEEVGYLPSGEGLKRLAPGFESLLADIYWLRTVQYFGGRRASATGKRFDLLRPLIEVTTNLDPRLEIAYRYGAIFLSEAYPVGAGQPRDGIAVMEKGAHANPRSWRLRQDLGFFHYVYLNDAQTASLVLIEASKLPEAPYWLEAMAGLILAKSGDRATSRRVWQAMYDQSEEGPIKKNAAINLSILDAYDGADVATQAVARFKERAGRLPAALAELHLQGLKDPSGTPYEFDPTTEKVVVSKQSPLWRPHYQ